MGLRFRRSFRVAPGLRLNFSGSGVSASVGPRGASTTFGRRGTHFNTGIPGTGIYSRTRVGTPSQPARIADKPGKITVGAQIIVDDDGTIRFLDADGTPLPQEWVARAKRQHGESIRNLIQESCDKINARVEGLGAIHLETPAPDERLKYDLQEFEKSPPSPPAQKSLGILGRLFKSYRARIEAEYAKRQADFEAAKRQWNAEKLAFEQSERAKKELLEVRVLSDVEAMEEVLEGALQDISWPRETAVSAEIRDSGRLIMIDVDLPEIEDMPKTTASVPSTGYKLTVKEMSAKKLQQLYLQHVHGIGFRIIGEVFAVLPTSQEVILSAFSQRPNKATGAINDEYLYSVRVKRDAWAAIDFKNLGALDVVAALERFELRREVTKTGLFRPIEPLGSST